MAECDPFAVVPGQVSIPIETKGYSFQFTRNWFRYRNQSTWSTFLKPKFGDGRPVSMLQIGVFEGMDLVWCCQNLLTHGDSEAVAVDPWVGTTKLDQQVMTDVECRARINLSPWLHTVTIRKGFSQDVLPQLNTKFDLIVIDGDHNAGPVIVDAQNSLKLSKNGTWLVFDDVRNRVPKKDHVQQGLDALLAGPEGQHMKLVWKHRYCDCYEVVGL